VIAANAAIWEPFFTFAAFSLPAPFHRKLTRDRFVL
jgi:hypothetical protein